MERAQGPNKLRLLFGGDVMLGRRVNEMIYREGAAYPLGALASLTRAADLFLVNLECAISPRDLRYSGPEKAFYFRADPVAAETLRIAGVDLVSLANNHALDADYDGLRDTLDILDDYKIVCVGAGENLEAARRPAFLEAKGQRLGVIACCDHQSDFAACTNQPGIRYVARKNPAMVSQITRDVEALARRVDHVIVAVHWQANWVPEVAPLYRSMARLWVEAGARVVWGHSPHHFQGVEWIGESAVLYATGDLVDDYRLKPDFRNDRQLLFQVILSDQGVEQILAYPLELSQGRTSTAASEARQWIARRFEQMCSDLGSRVVHDDGWLRVLPG